MSQQEKIKFIVNNGRYAGSVIELEQDQEYSLGRSFHCDIAIDDPRFAERQMLLKVGAEGVQIKLLAEGKLSVDGTAKDTNAQSEWRNMDLRSVFVMNDLEFSFEAPSSMYAALQQQQEMVTQAEVTAAPSLQESSEQSSQSQASVATTGAQKSSSNQGASHQSAPKDKEHNFDESETQVPSEDIRSEKTDVHIQVVPPTLADELDFDTGQDIQYKRNSGQVQKSDKSDSKQRNLIISAAAIGVIIILCGYYLIFMDSENDFSSQIAQHGGQQIEKNQLEENALVEPDFSSLAMQNNQQGLEQKELEHTTVFTGSQTDDPFASYDSMQEPQFNVSETMGQLQSATQSSAKEDLNEDVAQQGNDILKAKNAQKILSEETQVQHTQLDSKRDDPVISEIKPHDEKSHHEKGVEQLSSSPVSSLSPTDTVSLDQKPSTAVQEKFGQLSENQAVQLSQGVQSQEPKQGTQGTQKDTQILEEQFYEHAHDGSQGLLAVINGEASPATIVLPAVRDLLDGLGLGYLDVKTRQPRQGEVPPVVVVSGYVDHRQVWMRAKSILRQDIQEFGTLSDNVSSPEVRKAQLERWIEKSDLKGKVQTYLSERGLVAKVNLNPSQVATWEAISKQYVKKFDNTPALFVMRDPGDWLKIRSISFGERPYLVTQDGSVLLPGAKLKNGYSIVAIRRSGIELKDQFGSYTYLF